jgi:TolB-like protein
MSPEQAEGKALDERSDVFSFGAVLYEMLSGKRAFGGSSMAQVLSAVLRDDPPPLQAPAEIQRIVGKCLAKQPVNRFPNMGELKAALEQISTETLDRKRLGAKWPAWAALAILLGLAAYLVARSGLLHPASHTSEAVVSPHVIRSIAVLPLDNYSGDPSQEYFADGMTDEVTADLATVSQLRVISRGSVMQFKGEHRPSAPEIAKTLDVDAIVEGSVYRSNDKVRITAELIDARADKHLWAKSFERSSRDVLALQDELASAIAGEIHVQLTPAEQSRLASAPSVNPEAHDAYLKGRYFFSSPSDENLRKAIAQFEEAVKLSPDIAPAYSGLSDAYLWAGYNEGVLTAAEAKPRLKPRLRRLSNWTIIPPKRTPLWPYSSSSMNTIGQAVRASFGARSHLIPTTRSLTISSDWGWRFKAGSTKGLPRAGAPLNWIRFPRKFRSTLASGLPGNVSIKRRGTW